MSERPVVVLVHGLSIVQKAERAFRGVPEALGREGWSVRRPILQGDGTLDELAARLKAALADEPGPLVLLCHSMGGLWARRLLPDADVARRLVAIGTVSTPHGGSPLARPMTRVHRAYRDLVPEARARRNLADGPEEERVAAALGVRRLSVVARRRGRWRNPWFATTARLLRWSGCDPGDGLVPADAQAWGEVAFEVDLDHEQTACVPGAPKEAIELWVRLARACVEGRAARAKEDAAG